MARTVAGCGCSSTGDNRFRGGFHDFVIETGGVRVFPRLVSSEHRRDFKRDDGHDEHQGAQCAPRRRRRTGSSVLVLGPAGAGKSIIALTFVQSAVKRGESVAMFVFDEELGLLIQRSKVSESTSKAMRRTGNLHDHPDRCGRTDARRIFRAACVTASRHRREDDLIDSLTGYQAAMPEERSLILHMHELLQYCNRRARRPS